MLEKDPYLKLVDGVTALVGGAAMKVVFGAVDLKVTA